MRLLLIGLMLSLLCACQFSKQNTTTVQDIIKPAIVKPVVKEKESYGDYYLMLKELGDDELALEIEDQKQRKLEAYPDADFNLLLLYSLPNSPIHNAYTAKTILNEQNSLLDYSPEDLVLLTLLKDQLNQQLLLIESLSDQDQNLTQIEKQQNIIFQLEDETQQLQQQIIQLKKIEDAINKRSMPGQ